MSSVRSVPRAVPLLQPFRQPHEPVAGVVGLSHSEVQERSDAALPDLAALLGAALAGDPSAE